MPKANEMPADLREHLDNTTFQLLYDELQKFMYWQPIETAPKDGTWILLAGPSGYCSTPLRVEVCRYDDIYRPLQPWVNHAGDSFLDGGPDPTYWLPLPKIRSTTPLVLRP